MGSAAGDLRGGDAFVDIVLEGFDHRWRVRGGNAVALPFRNLFPQWRIKHATDTTAIDLATIEPRPDGEGWWVTSVRGRARHCKSRIGAAQRLHGIVVRELLARGCLDAVVHAAGAVRPDGRCFVFLGPGGSGKSTLAVCLLERRWTLLGDDLVGLQFPSGGGRVNVVALGTTPKVRLPLPNELADATRAMIQSHMLYVRPDKAFVSVPPEQAWPLGLGCGLDSVLVLSRHVAEPSDHAFRHRLAAGAAVRSVTEALVAPDLMADECLEKAVALVRTCAVDGVTYVSSEAAARYVDTAGFG